MSSEQQQPDEYGREALINALPGAKHQDDERMVDALIDVACRAFYDEAGVHWDTMAEVDQLLARRCVSAAMLAVVSEVWPNAKP
jgi:hypothetical protein